MCRCNRLKTKLSACCIDLEPSSCIENKQSNLLVYVDCDFFI